VRGVMRRASGKNETVSFLEKVRGER